MGKKRVLSLIVTAMLTLNMGTVTLAAENEAVSLNNSGTRKEGQNKPIVQAEIASSYKKICENDDIELYLDAKTLGIKIKNKDTGYIWSSTIEESDDNLNQIWQGFVESGVTIEYMTSKGKLEKASVSNSDAEIKIQELDNGFNANVNFKKQGITFKVNVSLNGNSVNVSLDNESIQEVKKNTQLQSIYLYPFMGATKKQEVSGYMFVPDGSGALIRLDERSEIATEPYVNRIYGKDFGTNGVTEVSGLANDLESIKYPVFGVVHNVNENGFVAIVEAGSEYGEINAYPSGITTDYNWITSKFIMRESYFQPTNKKGDGMVVNQSELNKSDISVTYNLLNGEDADYSGMAKTYQNYLVENGVLSKNHKENSDIPLKLDFLMSENEKGLVGEKLVEMTSIEDIRDIVSKISDNGINNIDIVARGWSKGGYTGAAVNHFPTESKIGSMNEWEDLVSDLAEVGIDVYMYTDYIKGFDDTKGISIVKDSAQTIAEQIIKGKNTDYNFITPLTSMEFYEKEQEKFEKNGIGNIAIGSIGDNLYSDFSERHKTTRTESMEIYKSGLEKTKTNNALYKPNDYLWKNTDAYYNIPMSSSNYLMLTDNVPFLQIVLKGYIDFYAPELNFVSGEKDTLLQMIDYGVYPSYYLTEEDSVKLINTESKWLYTSKFEIWNDEIKAQYDIINSALKNVEGEIIIDRNVIVDGVVEVVYSNNVKIIVNYNDSIYKNDSVIVEAKDFKVMGGE